MFPVRRATFLTSRMIVSGRPSRRHRPRSRGLYPCLRYALLALKSSSPAYRHVCHESVDNLAVLTKRPGGADLVEPRSASSLPRQRPLLLQACVHANLWFLLHGQATRATHPARDVPWRSLALERRVVNKWNPWAFLGASCRQRFTRRDWHRLCSKAEIRGERVPKADHADATNGEPVPSWDAPGNRSDQPVSNRNIDQRPVADSCLAHGRNRTRGKARRSSPLGRPSLLGVGEPEGAKGEHWGHHRFAGGGEFVAGIEARVTQTRDHDYCVAAARSVSLELNATSTRFGPMLTSVPLSQIWQFRSRSARRATDAPEVERKMGPLSGPEILRICPSPTSKIRELYARWWSGECWGVVSWILVAASARMPCLLMTAWRT